MKLCQRILLNSRHQISGGLWVLEADSSELLNEYRRLMGPCELSFHPYSLEAWAAPDLLSQEQPLYGTLHIAWGLNLCDDQEAKPLLTSLSSNKCLLLLSEAMLGVEEIVRAVGFSLVSIIPEPRQNLLVVHVATSTHTSQDAILGGALILKTAMDALLFVRGLAIGSHTLTIGPGGRVLNPKFEETLRAVLVQ